MPQLSYGVTLAPGLPGMKGDSGYDRVATRVNQNASALPFGVFVKESQGTYLNGADVLGSAADVIAGVTVKSDTVPIDPSVGVAAGSSIDAIPNTGIFDCMELGAVWVRAEQVLVPGDPVFARYANGQGGAGATNIRGVVRKDADTASAVRIKGARVMRSGVSPSGTQMALIYFDKMAQNTQYA